MTAFAQRQSEAYFRLAHFFQNGTQRQSETCLRMAHVSERHTKYTQMCAVRSCTLHFFKCIYNHAQITVTLPISYVATML